MVAVNVSFDGTRVDDADALGSVWTDLGGGKAASEPDFVYQGTASVSEKVGTTEGGVAYVDPGTIDFTTPNVWIAKCIATNSSALNVVGATGGILEIGSGGRRSAYDRYYVIGSDTYPIQGGWLIVPIDPNGGNQSARPGTAPTLTAINYFGWACTFGATSKAENVALDAIDYIANGTGLTLTGGDGVDADGTFDDFATTDEDSAGNNRWGIVTTREGILYVTGVLTIGTATTATVFTDTGSVVVWPDALFLNSTGFYGLDLDLGDASTVITITGCSFISRGTSAGTVDTRADFEVTGTSGTASLDSCTFQNMSNFIFNSATTIVDSSIETVFMQQGSGNISGTVITTVSATSIACLQDPTFGSTTDLHDCDFVQGGSGHAIEIDTAGTYNFNGLTFTDYGADTTDSAALDITASTGTVTINITNGGTPTYKTAGATVVINNNITLTLTGLRENTEVRIYTIGPRTEIAGTENATDGTFDDRSFSFSVAASTVIDITIFNTSYNPVYIEDFTAPTSSASIPIAQVFDRSYDNP